MLLTHSCVMDVILPLLAPGGFSWLRDASCESSSVMMLVPILSKSRVYVPSVLCPCCGDYESTLRASLKSRAYQYLALLR